MSEFCEKVQELKNILNKYIKQNDKIKLTRKQKIALASAIRALNNINIAEAEEGEIAEINEAIANKKAERKERIDALNEQAKIKYNKRANRVLENKKNREILRVEQKIQNQSLNS
jgi:hypothetical protein